MESDIKNSEAMKSKDREFFINGIGFRATQKNLEDLDKLESEKEKAKFEKRIFKRTKQHNSLPY